MRMWFWFVCFGVYCGVKDRVLWNFWERYIIFCKVNFDMIWGEKREVFLDIFVVLGVFFYIFVFRIVCRRGVKMSDWIII